MQVMLLIQCVCLLIYQRCFYFILQIQDSCLLTYQSSYTGDVIDSMCLFVDLLNLL